ncbi:MAG: hypothetical protein CL915_06335 [Deltaproteobacteria bacterium]|jgi:hypothetical protein|nr:hypothetical protein [Deltaproteobacteria bacterium]
MNFDLQTHSQSFTRILTEILRCFCYVMCDEELIPSSVCSQDRLQVIGLIDPLVPANQNN